jgi:Uma2 family endonuclease
MRFAEAGNLGAGYVSPMSVRLWEGKIREPDVFFVRREHADRIGESVIGPPDWVAEVISKSTRKTDEVDKLAEYAQAGIPEYWMLDYKKRSIRVYLLPEGERVYTLAATYTAGQVARSATIDGFEVAVDGLFAP